MKKIAFFILLMLKLNASEGDAQKFDQFTVREKNNIPKEDLIIGADSFYDPQADYIHFSGRVTDRDETTSIVKVSSENKNIRFFRASDLVLFKVQNNPKSENCEGHVRAVEDKYFVIFVKDIHPCFPGNEYFRRGTALIMQSDKLLQRVQEASIYRASLLVKKKDYMKQLNHINQDVFTYEEKKIQVASEFDRKIAEIEAQKIKELDKILSERNDEMRLQRELAYRLDSVDRELSFYRLEKQELLIDRWHLDQDLGYPVYKRPEAPRAALENINN